MTAVTTTAPAAPITGFAAMFVSIARWNDARKTRAALQRLSNRELDDIGLTYGDIEEIATRGTRA